MGAPQIIWIVLTAIGLLAVAYMHGKTRESKYSIWRSLVSMGITVGLLIWGGVF